MKTKKKVITNEVKKPPRETKKHLFEIELKSGIHYGEISYPGMDRDDALADRANALLKHPSFLDARLSSEDKETVIQALEQAREVSSLMRDSVIKAKQYDFIVIPLLKVVGELKRPAGKKEKKNNREIALNYFKTHWGVGGRGFQYLPWEVVSFYKGCLAGFPMAESNLQKLFAGDKIKEMRKIYNKPKLEPREAVIATTKHFNFLSEKHCAEYLYKHGVEGHPRFKKY